ncbi:heme-binding domain-containing protein [Flavobacterium sp. GT2N3]|uniref:heme-binding domain-containing protein n=1 Tax=unclassified Flavobacterium TaxID=196869 RepID=UPI003AAD463C
MKKIIKKILVIGFVIFLLMQLYQPARNIDYGQVSPIHFTKVYHVPNNVQIILKTSCYDCHSNNTNYPWYSYSQPGRIFMENHIKEGKENLNFSEWGNYGSRKQRNKLDRIVKQIKSDEMPLSSYTLIHKNAILTTIQKQEIINWIQKTADSLSSEY